MRFQAYGRTKTYRFTATTQIQSLAVPAGFRYATIKNAGGVNAARIQFGLDGGSDFFSLAPGEKVEGIGVTVQETFKYQSVALTTTIEVILWG